MILHRRLFRKNSGTAPAPENWQAPAELSGSTPRPVVLTAAGKGMAMFAVLLAATSLGGGIALYLAATGAQARRARFEREGITTEARVTGVRHIHGDHPRVVLTYTYTADGQPFQGRLSLSARDGAGYNIGSPVTVRYLRTEPGNSAGLGRIGGVPIWVVALVPPIPAFAALLIAGVLRCQRRLLSQGRVAQGRIVKSGRVYNGQHAGYRVVFEFRTLSGSVRKGRHDSSSKPLPVGAPVTVVYDPDKPSRNGSYPFSLMRVGAR